MNKLDLLKKLKALANDNRGNNNERESAEKQLNKLMEKYHITEEDIGIEEVKNGFGFQDRMRTKINISNIIQIIPRKTIIPTKK